MAVKSHKDALPIQVRYFKCPVCGTVAPATKTRHKTSKGHIKTMYCYVCKEITNHEQTE